MPCGFLTFYYYLTFYVRAFSFIFLQWRPPNESHHGRAGLLGQLRKSACPDALDEVDQARSYRWAIQAMRNPASMLTRPAMIGVLKSTRVGEQFVVISASSYTSLSVKRDGTLQMWGMDNW